MTFMARPGQHLSPLFYILALYARSCDEEREGERFYDGFFLVSIRYVCSIENRGWKVVVRERGRSFYREIQ